MRLKPRSERKRSAEEIISDLRPRLQRAAPVAEIEFVQLLQDMLGDLEGSPTPIEVKIFGDDPEVLARASEPVEEMLGQGRRRGRRRRDAARQPRGDVDDRPRGGGAARSHGRGRLVAARGGLARRRRHGPAAARPTRAGAGPPAGLLPARSGEAPADAGSDGRRQARPARRPGAARAIGRRVGADAREPARHGARERAPRGPRPRQRRRARSRSDWAR